MEDWSLDDLGDCLQELGWIAPSSHSFPASSRLSFISSYVDSLDKILRPINLTIHDHPELNYEEYIAHEALTSFLRTRAGWKVTSSAYGIATAFVAEFDSGREGPVISFNAEYDALPGIGHACGHNLITVASLSAALAAGATIDKFKLSGKVVLFGTPAEEGGGGKIKLLDAGAYTDHKVDVSLMAHPGNVPDAALVRTAAYVRFKVEYFGKEAHAAAAPWEGVNALDALIVAYNGLSVLRQQTMPGDIIQGHITNGGSAPNIIHAYTSGVFIVRANTRERRELLRKKVNACFEAGAIATGATLKITFETSYDDHVPNHSLARFYRQHFNSLGGAIPGPAVDEQKGRSGASTDQGNVSYAIPSLHSGFYIESEIGGHSPAFTKASRTKDAHEKALRVGKALAATGIEVLTREGYLEEIKKEFEKMVRDGAEANLDKRLA